VEKAKKVFNGMRRIRGRIGLSNELGRKKKPRKKGKG
jgi:hypothetical protein